MSIRRQLGDLAKSLDSSAVGSFLSKGASEADFTTISYSDVSGTPSVVADSAVATSIIDSAYVSARVITVAAGLDSATTINLLDSNYMAARSGGGAGFYVYNYDATSGQTTFQDSDAAGNVMSYSADGIIVFYNGVMLPTADYTATDGTSVVLGSAADSQDVLTIAKWATGSSGGPAAVWYGDRAVVGGGSGVSQYNTIDYFDLTTSGNATDFGDRIIAKSGIVGTSDGTYGTFTGHSIDIDKVTISTPGNATDHGDLSNSSHRFSAGIGDGTYGYIIAGNYSGYTTNIDQWSMTTSGNGTSVGNLSDFNAYHGCWGNASRTLITGGAYGGDKNIEYITLSNSISGSATFGNLTTARAWCYAAGDLTRAVMGGGTISGSKTNIIDYVTIATPGNATDFGDLTAALMEHCATSNATYAAWTGGNDGAYNAVINYVTIQTTGNATDHGDLTIARQSPGATSGSPS